MIDESRMLLDDCSQLSLGQNLAKVDGHFPCGSGKRAFFEYSVVLFQIVASQLSQIGAKWAGITNLRQLLHIPK